MKRKLWLISGLLLLILGCNNFYMICSLNPFYLEKNIILIPEVEGSWSAKPVKISTNSADSASSKIWGIADTTSIWKIQRVISTEVIKTKKGIDSTTYRPQNYYPAKLLSASDSVLYAFKVVFFYVKNSHYADFIPFEKESLMNSKLASGSFFEMHTLARLTQIGDFAELSWLGADCMKEMIEKKRVRVNYQWVKETGRFLLTASSAELTGMIERYADQPRFIDWNTQQARLNLSRLN